MTLCGQRSEVKGRGGKEEGEGEKRREDEIGFFLFLYYYLFILFFILFCLFALVCSVLNSIKSWLYCAVYKNHVTPIVKV